MIRSSAIEDVTLVLGADMRPDSWSPLSIIPWQEALTKVILGRVSVLQTYDRQVRSAYQVFDVPSVVMLLDHHPRRRVPFTRWNVFLRDGFRCQYCGERFGAADLTFDHVIPRCLGGVTSWENVVTACSLDNLRKGHKLLANSAHKGEKLPASSSIKLISVPRCPTPYEIDIIARRLCDPHMLHKTWLDFLYWDSVLET